nr:ABC transporter ATP-binding protein [Kibdelosporangium sp. MJ126-NF4]CEL18529.1 ABC transporter (iron.B12.siderophore.hemin), ATP-binding component [Kibdelosporangium sp. MJ126-NF4]CTQ98013.1 ABC transporter (iron.B12.siderophore.hemin), ATP-binding component [Kibdelosporangium sp. MJ126-NF4]
MRIEVSGIGVVIDDSTILSSASLTVPRSSVTGLIGPNGSGKSTLLRCVYRALRPSTGSVLIGDEDVWRTPARRAGKRTAVVSQDHDLDNDFSVTEVVAMGRIPHKGILDRESTADREIVRSALDQVSMRWAGNRIFASLSGGERQRVLVARAIAQQAPVLLLDEPTNHLDVGAQLELLDLVTGLDLTIIAALHDLDLAAAYCDQLVLLRSGTVVAAGSAVDVLDADRVAEVFGVRSTIVPHPLTGRPHFVTALAGREQRIVREDGACAAGNPTLS